jgi:hypothetical protein
MDQGDNALMGRGPGQLSQLVARFVAHADAGLPAEGYEARKAVVRAFLSHLDVIKAALAGFERFLDRVQPVKNFHEG